MRELPSVSSVSISRSLYRLLVRVHPAEFQERFGAEMLWIFEEECRRGGAGRLLWDGVVSLARQRCRLERRPAQVSAISGALVPDTGIGPGRLLQAVLLTGALAFCFALMAGLRCPLPFSVRWPQGLGHGALSLRVPERHRR